MYAMTIGLPQEHIDSVVRELGGNSDRTIGIVGAALVESMLTDSLKQYMRGDEKMYAEMFRPGGMFGDFAVKAQLGFLIGIHRRQTYDDLRFITKIRNEFAHKLEKNSFDQVPIVGLANKIKICERYMEWEGHVEGWPHEISEQKPDAVSLKFDPGQDNSTPKGHFLRAIAILLMWLAYLPDDRHMPSPTF